MLSVELSALPMWSCSMLNYALCAMLSLDLTLPGTCNCS